MSLSIMAALLHSKLKKTRIVPDMSIAGRILGCVVELLSAAEGADVSHRCFPLMGSLETALAVRTLWPSWARYQCLFDLF